MEHVWFMSWNPSVAIFGMMKLQENDPPVLKHALENPPFCSMNFCSTLYVKGFFAAGHVWAKLRVYPRNIPLDLHLSHYGIPFSRATKITKQAIAKTLPVWDLATCGHCATEKHCVTVIATIGATSGSLQTPQVRLGWKKMVNIEVKSAIYRPKVAIIDLWVGATLINGMLIGMKIDSRFFFGKSKRWRLRPSTKSACWLHHFIRANINIYIYIYIHIRRFAY